MRGETGTKSIYRSQILYTNLGIKDLIPRGSSLHPAPSSYLKMAEFFMHKLRTMDFMLSQEELSRRNARRKRNREAAARCRERRMETIKELEDKVKALQNERDELRNQKDVMAYELDKCRFQVSAFCKVRFFIFG